MRIMNFDVEGHITVITPQSTVIEICGGTDAIKSAHSVIPRVHLDALYYPKKISVAKSSCAIIHHGISLLFCTVAHRFKNIEWRENVEWYHLAVGAVLSTVGSQHICRQGDDQLPLPYIKRPGTARGNKKSYDDKANF